MQTISSALSTAIVGGAQEVSPKVEATWATSKYLPNAKIYSSGDFYSDVIKAAIPFVWYRLNDVANTMNDDAGGGYDGDFFGTWTDEQTGIPSEAYTGGDKAINFNGSTGYGTVTEAEYGTIFRLTDNFTIEAWAKPDALTPGGKKTIIAKANANTSSGIEYQMYQTTGDKYEVTVYIGTVAKTVTSTTSCSTGAYHHIVVTKSGANLTLYINGVQEHTIATATGSVQGTNGDLSIGRLGGVNAEYFDGNIDEVVIYTRVITDDEILSHYLMGARASDVMAAQIFTSTQAFNGKERSSMKWGVVDAKDPDGNIITCDSGYRVMGDTTSIYEYGWWSRRKSDGSAVFSGSEWLWSVFDDRLANYIDVYTSEHFSGINTYKIYYKNTSNVWTQVGGTHTMPTGLFYQSHSLGSVLTIRGVKIEILTTRVAGEPARVQELSPIYKTNISTDVISTNVDKQRDNYDSTVPVGITAANTFNIVLDNTSKTYATKGTAGLAPYMRKDVILDASLGWKESTYLGMPGNGTALVSAPDNAALSIQGDLDIRAFVAFDNWDYAVQSVLMGKWGNSGFRSYLFSIVPSTRTVYLQWAPVGTGVTTVGSNATFTAPANGERLGFRATLDVNNGTGGRTVAFYTSTDFVTWTQLGTDVVDNSATTAIFDSTSIVEIGSITNGTGFHWAGKFFAGEIRAGIGGALRGSVDFRNLYVGQPTYIDPQGNTWTMTGTSVGDYLEYVNQGRFYIDDWNEDSDSMTVTGNCRDYSKFLQDEPFTDGALFENFTAGQAIVDLAARGGVPREKISYVNTWPGAIMDSTPVAWYRFNESSGTVLNDELGVSDGTISGSPVLANPGAIVSESTYSLRFDGTDDVCSVTDTNSLDLTSNFSIEVWVKLYASLSGTATLIDKGGAYKIHILTNGTVQFETGSTISSGTGLITNDGLWHHILVTYDNSASPKAILYVDGISRITGSPTAPSANASALTIGSKADASQKYKGYMDELVLYKRTLNSTNVVQHYRAGRYPKQTIFPYLYAADGSLWEGMLNIAIADLGIFYFDESEMFTFENADSYYDTSDPVSTKHTTIQYDLDDNTNIISGDQITELQANIVSVKVSPKSAQVGRQGIWRAEAGASLAITSLSSNIGRGVASISVTSTDSPLWPDSGSFKIDDEIINYTSKTLTSFEGLERGAHGTSPSSHTSGSLVREHRVFDVEYSSAPVADIDYPFITARESEHRVDVDEFYGGPYKAYVRVSANTSNTTGTIVLLEGTDPTTELNYYMAIAGIPITSNGSGGIITEQVASTSESIRRYGAKKIEIDNEFIQDAATAKRIGQFLINHYQNPVPILDIKTLGIPHLQLGDRIRIIGFDQLSITNKEYWILGIQIDYNGGVDQSLHLREVS